MIDKISEAEFISIERFYKLLLKKGIITKEEYKSELKEIKKKIDLEYNYE